MKVYVITKGIYSDYHICGVALDKERANRLASFFQAGTIKQKSRNTTQNASLNVLTELVCGV